MRRITIATTILLALSACPIQGTPGSGDDDAGIPEDPPDQPGWKPASDRLIGALPYPGYLNPPSELEYAPMAPSVLNKPDLGDWASLPPKPWVPGIPDVYDAPATGDPTYWEIPANSFTPEPTVTPTEETRSGLVGNFAFWAQIAVPESHPRPPVVWMNILAYVGHPLFAGRDNAFGLPCSTRENPLQNSLSTGVYAWEALGPNADCERHMLFTGVSPVSANFPFQHDVAESVAKYESILQAQCLDNGGEYKVIEIGDGGEVLGGSALSAPSRNGLVWLNWDEVESIQQWINAELGIGELGVLMDYILASGFDYWPTDPTYRYSRWSTTGICAFAVRLAIKPSPVADIHCNWVNKWACPKGMVPILPSFDAEGLFGACHESGQAANVDGYCSYPHYEVPPGAAFNPNGDLDIAPLEPNGHGIGIPNSYVVSLSPGSFTELSRAYAAIELIEMSDGLMVDAFTPFGERSLAQLGLEVDDLVVGLGFAEPCEPRGTTRGCSIVNPDIASLTAYATEQALAGDMMILDVSARDGWRKRIHVVPTFQPLG